jgi:predicted nucleotide-binding protein
MRKKSDEEKRQKTALLVSRTKAERKLRERIEKADAIPNGLTQTDEDLRTATARFGRWFDYTDELLALIFSGDKYASEFRMAGPEISIGVSFPGKRLDVGAEFSELEEKVKAKVECLRSIIERLELIPELQKAEAHDEKPRPVAPSRKIFVVHGRDEAAKQQVARLLERLQLEPIILHEKPNKGRTIIEKIEQHADVAFAVVLLTPDDIGGTAQQPQELKKRARQNVIFELGYFFAKLGRDKACALYKPGVELPSDMSGILYKLMDDAGRWELELAKEIRAAGITVDLNLLG